MRDTPREEWVLCRGTNPYGSLVNGEFNFCASEGLIVMNTPCLRV
jgi:hypothetical protein